MSLMTVGAAAWRRSGSPQPAGGWYDAVFKPGDAGMAFDFNDLSSVYQDAAGTTPVTNAGDPIESVRCQITGALAVLQGSYSSTLGFDATHGKYYANVGSTTSGNSPLFRASGTLPAALLGDTPLSLVTVADYSNTQQSLFAHIGATSPANGNSASLGHFNDPTLVLAFLQWGSGRGSRADAISGVRSAVGTKGARVSNIAPSQLYVDGSPVTTSGQMSSTSVNVAVQNFDIARITPAGLRVYTVGVIDRALTALEAAAVHAAAL